MNSKVCPCTCCQEPHLADAQWQLKAPRSEGTRLAKAGQVKVLTQAIAKSTQELLDGQLDQHNHKVEDFNARVREINEELGPAIGSRQTRKLPRRASSSGSWVLEWSLATACARIWERVRLLSKRRGWRRSCLSSSKSSPDVLCVCFGCVRDPTSGWQRHCCTFLTYLQPTAHHHNQS